MRPTLLAACILLCVTQGAASQNLLIYDKGPLVTHPGGGSGGADASIIETAPATPAMNVFGYGIQRTLPTTNHSVSDSFWSCGMVVSEIEVFSYQTGSSTTSTITGLWAEIWNADPSASPPPPITNRLWGDLDPTTGTNVMTSTTWTNIYRVTQTTLPDVSRPVMSVRGAVTPPLVLPPGQYWLHFQASGSLASGPWMPPVAIMGHPVTGGGRQRLTAGTWQDVLNPGAPAAGSPQGAPFRLYGIPGGPVAGAVAHGAGKAGTSGVPAWTLAHRPFNGLWNHPLQITNGFANAVPVALLGIGQANVPIPPFGTLHVGNVLLTVVMPAFNTAGTSTLRLNIPGGTCGGPINLQAFYADQGATGGVAHTSGMELTIGN